MARIRTIKPDFWSDEKLANVCREARLLYIGLWNLADDHGVCKGSPGWIKSQLFGYDDLAKDTVVGWLKELTYLGRISEFDHNGETFFYIHNFLKHQRIDNPAKFRNAVPPDFSEEIVEDSQEIVEDSSKNPLVIVSSNSNSKVIVGEGKVEAPPDDVPFDEILSDLNEKAGTKCRLSEPTRKAIKARWAEGYRLTDFQHVHAVKCQDWLHDPGMKKYLHPDTLYRPSKFEKYVNQELREKQEDWKPPDD